MRGPIWKHWIPRGILVVLLLLVGLASLVHAAEHVESDSNCPICVQGHACGPILGRVPVVTLPPAPAERATVAALPVLENGRHASPCVGRAPPFAIA